MMGRFNWQLISVVYTRGARAAVMCIFLSLAFMKAFHRKRIFRTFLLELRTVTVSSLSCSKISAGVPVRPGPKGVPQ